jgi:SHS2 domain-containing protein
MIYKKNIKKFKFLEHTADVKFLAFGKNKEEAFENSALALKESMCGKTRIKENKERKIFVKGKDDEARLYVFLEEILFLLDAEKFIISKIKSLKINENKINAVISGDDAKNYHFTNKVKAITYNDMLIEKNKGKWTVQAVLDV